MGNPVAPSTNRPAAKARATFEERLPLITGTKRSELRIAANEYKANLAGRVRSAFANISPNQAQEWLVEHLRGEIRETAAQYASALIMQFAGALYAAQRRLGVHVPDVREYACRAIADFREALESTGVFPSAAGWTRDVVVRRCITTCEGIIAERKIAGDAWELDNSFDADAACRLWTPTVLEWEQFKAHESFEPGWDYRIPEYMMTEFLASRSGRSRNEITQEERRAVASELCLIHGAVRLVPHPLPKAPPQPIENPQFWAEREAEFRTRKPGETSPIESCWFSDLEQWSFRKTHGSQVPKEGPERLFKSLAVIAATGLGTADADQGWITWLDALRLYGYSKVAATSSSSSVRELSDGSIRDGEFVPNYYMLLFEPPLASSPDRTVGVYRAWDSAIHEVEDPFLASADLCVALRAHAEAARRRNEKLHIETQGVYDRLRTSAKNSTFHEQEQLIRDARDYVRAKLPNAVLKMSLPANPDIPAIATAITRLRDRLSTQLWDKFLPRHPKFATLQIGFKEFNEAVWDGGEPESMQDYAMTMAAERAVGETSADQIRPFDNSEAAFSAPPEIVSRAEIEKLATDSFAAIHEKLASDNGERLRHVLAEVRERGDTGGYLPALIAWGTTKLREAILACADAYVDAFSTAGIPTDRRTKEHLETASKQIAGGAISGIRGEIHLLTARNRALQITSDGAIEREIEAARVSALNEGRIRLERQSIAMRKSTPVREIGTADRAAPSGVQVDQPAKLLSADRASRPSSIPQAGDNATRAARQSVSSKRRYPNRAVWLAERLQERALTKHDLARHRGPDHKTTQKVLDGLHVREEVLEKIVEALNTCPRAKKLPHVDLLNIPRD
jgi:hypothetical protein